MRSCMPCWKTFWKMNDSTATPHSLLEAMEQQLQAELVKANVGNIGIPASAPEAEVVLGRTIAHRTGVKEKEKVKGKVKEKVRVKARV